MLSIQNLSVKIQDTTILQGLNLSVRAGEVHAIMGPNGSGKTTLSNVLAGRDGYTSNAGRVLFEEKDLLSMTPEARAIAGIFLAMQYPIEIPGVNNLYFLKTAVNAQRTARGETLIDAFDFMALAKKYLQEMGMDEQFLKRAVNSGFSGGEKKRNEIMQLLLLQPKLAILDETDSGLDVDALQVVARGVNQFRSRDHAILLITHYQRLLNYVEPDFVHILVNGKIVESGDKSLALHVEAQGYAKWV